MRTEEELAMWQAMDQQRNDAQANSKSNKLPRLMQVHCRAPTHASCLMREEGAHTRCTWHNSTWHLASCTWHLAPDLMHMAH
jgi:hypothetical protein